MENEAILSGFSIEWYCEYHRKYYREKPESPKDESLTAYKEWCNEITDIQDFKTYFSQFAPNGYLFEAIPTKEQLELIEIDSQNMFDFQIKPIIQDIENLKGYGNALAVSQKMNIKAMTDWIAPYPTLGEINKRAAYRYFSSFGAKPIVRQVIGFLKKHGFKIWGYYRIVVGIVLLILIYTGYINS